MEERMKVVLEATIDKFKSNMDKAKEMMKQFGSEAKKNFSTGLNINKDEAEKNLEQLKGKLEQLGKTLDFYKQKASEGIDTSKSVKFLNKQYQELDTTIKQTEKDLNTVNKTPMGALGLAVQNIKNTFKDIGSRIKQVFSKDIQEGTEKVKQNVEAINKAGKGSGLSNMFSDGLKSLKRFALSLFGLQSIWRIIGKASSAYLQQNQELSSKIQAVWNGLGELLSPIINFLANLFLKLIGYINVLTKALFDFDFVARANTRTLKNQSKQANNTAKALSGLDEITNINQDNKLDTDTSQPTGLIEIPELDAGLVKKLQDLAYWLKENWDWISKVGIALGAVFGASVIAGWIKNIGSLLGVAGAGATGGAGLLGLASTLAWIGGLGVLAIEIYLAYDTIDQFNKVNQLKIDAINTNKKLHNDYMVALKDKKEDAKQYQKNSKEIAQYTGMLKANIEMSKHDMETHHDKSTYYKNAQKEIEANVQAYADLYKQGQLNEEQTKTYAKYMNDLGYNLDGTKKTIGDTAKEIRDNLIKSVKDATKKTDEMTTATDKSKQALDKSKTSTNLLQQELEKISKSPFNVKINDSSINTTKTDTQDMVTFIANKLKNPFKVNVEEGTKTSTVKSNVADMVTYVANQLRNPFSLIFKSKVEKPSQNDIQGVVSAITNGVNNVLKLVGLKIPGFAIGTDLVKRDGLAYIHAGEQIVPADAVKGGYTGGNNDETNNLLRALIEVVQEKDFSATISSDDVGKASVNYIRNQNRIMGGSVI